MRATDWSASPLGAVETWPASLRAAVQLSLDSALPTAVVWGPSRVLLYNDAFRSAVTAPPLARPAGASTAPLWQLLEPLVRQAESGEPVAPREVSLASGSSGSVDVAASPIRDDEGRVGGALLVLTPRSERLRAELDRAHARFLGNMSHELRTPLTLMLGPIEELLSGSAGELSAAAHDDVATLQRNALRLHKLLDGLLDLASIEAGRVEAVFEPTDLAPLTAELADGFRSTIERAGLRLVVDCAALAAPAYVDRRMWEKVVLNLVSNALKFTFEGEIAVTLREVESAVELEVRDTGSGVAHQDVAGLFRRFQRAADARARTAEGAGIGLALVQEFVRLHGGTLAVDSRVGHGARFVVRLPRGSAHLPPSRIGAARAPSASRSAAPFVEEAQRWIADESRAPAFETTAAADGSRSRVLVVDDNQDMRQYLERLLAARWDVESAASAESALAALAERRFDLILTDVMLPGMDGLELARRLRSDPRTRSVAVIMLSARAGEEARAEGLDAGADDYLVKPFGARELVARVRSHLELGRVRDLLGDEHASVAEHARRREAELRTFLDSSNAAIFAKDLEGRHITVNRRFEQLVGVPAAAALGRTDSELFEPALAAAFLDSDRRAIEADRALHVEHDFGGRHYLVVKFPLREEGGRVYGVGCIATDVTEQRAVQERLLEESRVKETLYRLSASFTTELDEEKLLQLITDEATNLTGADFGSFFFNVKDDRGEALMLYTLSGASKERFAGFRMPRATPLFAPTFKGEGSIRLDDVRKDPRFGRWGPQPAGHLPVVSYLAVPVVARSGEVLGGLFFGHKEAGRFTAQHEQIITGIAGHAAVALENARLYGALRKSQESASSAYELAAQADRRKDEFLAMLGHELRNPLAPIVFALQLIRLRGESSSERELTVIERQVRHLARLVDDLLDISRITRGKITLEREQIELWTVVSRAIEQVSPLIEERRQVLSVEVPPSGLRVCADPVRLAQIVGNLLANAAKYTDPAGRIRVSAAREQDAVVLRVKDTGVGIAPDVLPSIFDAFVQGARALDRSRGGLGVGLALVKSLVELHGGAVAAHSAGLGHGSEFVVRLPLPERVVTPVTETPAPPVTSSNEGAERPVLVVDDNTDAAELMASVLREVGYRVEVAHDPASALTVAERLRPEICLLDIGLPVMDGYELGQRIRQLLGNPAIRLVAVTGYGQDSDRKRSRDAGFDAHLVKPIEIEQLVAVVAPRRA